MQTPKKDLRGGRPLWADTPRIRVRSRSLLNSESCDVAVIGAGISGALVALELTENGHDVVIVDRAEPCRGSTFASTAMIQFELDTPLIELADKKGGAIAERIWRCSFKAVGRLGDLIPRPTLPNTFSDDRAPSRAGTTKPPADSLGLT